MGLTVAGYETAGDLERRFAAVGVESGDILDSEYNTR